MLKKLIILFIISLGYLAASASSYPYTNQTVTQPAYQFRSTSTYSSTLGNSSFATTTVYEPGCTSPTMSKVRRDYNPWSEEGNEEGDPTGLGVGNVDTPVGEPLIMLVFALLYVCYKRRKPSDA